MTTTYNYEIFPILQVTLKSEPASFWQEKVVATIILHPALAQMLWWRKQDSYQMLVLSFIILRSKEHVTSFTIKITVQTFLVDNGKMKFSGKSTLMRIRKKPLSQFSYSQSSLSSNLKVSYVSLILTARKAFQPSYSMLLWG